MTALPFADGGFDAVVCVFGVFFAPDPASAVRELRRVVRPGGTLAVTTWGPRTLEPLDSVFREAVGQVRPDLLRPAPWRLITEPEPLIALLTAGGVDSGDVELTAGSDRQILARPEDAWTVVLGSGYRGTVEAMTPEEAALVKQACVGAAMGHLDSDALYARVRRPA